MVIANFSTKLERRLNQIEKNHQHFSHLVEKRYTNEKLLQLEALRIISNIQNVVEFLPERYYPDGKSKVDIWFKTRDKREHWMEVKMRPTNYHKGSHHGKAITHGRKSIIRDYERLNELDSDYKKYLLFSFLPIYDDRYDYFERQLDIISREIGCRIGEPIKIKLKKRKKARLEVFLAQL